MDNGQCLKGIQRDLPAKNIKLSIIKALGLRDDPENLEPFLLVGIIKKTPTLKQWIILKQWITLKQWIIDNGQWIIKFKR